MMKYFIKTRLVKTEYNVNKSNPNRHNIIHSKYYINY